MKYKSIICIFIFICLVSCSKTSPTSFMLEGSFEGKKIEDSTIIQLSYISLKDNNWYKTTDTATIIGGKFFFEGNIEELTSAYIDFENSFIHIYMEPVKMKLVIDKEKPYAYRLTGTSVEKENIELRTELSSKEKVLHEELMSFYRLLDRYNNSNDTTFKDSLMIVLNQFITNRHANVAKTDSIRLAFTIKHNIYHITPDLLYILIRDESIDVDTIRQIYNSMPEEIKNSQMGQLANKQIEQAESRKQSDRDNLAFDFTRKASSGNIVKLSELGENKYILLDFWASWCRPCLKEIPKMKDIYNKYKDKGLVIIGVSLDTEKDSWLKSIDKHELDIWTQVLSNEENNDERLFTEDISEIYNIGNYIPFYILIDKDRKIIAKWNHIEKEELTILNNIFKENN